MTFRQAQAAALALAAMIALADERLAAAEATAGSKSFRHRRSSLVARGRASGDLLTIVTPLGAISKTEPAAVEIYEHPQPFAG